MKKKKAIDPYSQYPIPTRDDVKKAKGVDWNAPPVRIKDNVDDKYIVNLEKIDDWCEKWLKNNKEIKKIKGYYPYKDYTIIDDLLRKNGKELMDRLLKECPIKGRDLKNTIFDSMAFGIFRNKIDPKSLFSMPEYGSFWDRISDKGHA